MLSRRGDWAEMLHGFLEENRQTRFAYGTWDCCLFVAAAIAVMTEVDIATEFRGRYRSRAGALQSGAEIAGMPTVKGIVESVAAAHAMEPVPIMKARRGDMVLISRAHGRDASLGLVALNGREIAIALRHGIGAVPLEGGNRAWRV